MVPGSSVFKPLYKSGRGRLLRHLRHKRGPKKVRGGQQREAEVRTRGHHEKGFRKAPLNHSGIQPDRDHLHDVFDEIDLKIE